MANDLLTFLTATDFIFFYSFAFCVIQQKHLVQEWGAVQESKVWGARDLLSVCPFFCRIQSPQDTPAFAFMLKLSNCSSFC